MKDCICSLLRRCVFLIENWRPFFVLLGYRLDTRRVQFSTVKRQIKNLFLTANYKIIKPKQSQYKIEISSLHARQLANKTNRATEICMKMNSKVNNFFLFRKTLNKTYISLKLSPTNYQRLLWLVYWNFSCISEVKISNWRQEAG